MKPVDGEPFFHRRATHQWIKELSQPRDWTIYAGLGVSIDRTGLSWSGLVEAILAEHIPDRATRLQVLSQQGPLRAATILESFYMEPGRSRDDLVGDIRKVLYNNRRLMAGMLSQSLAEFAYTVANRGNSVVIVTPNYDDYLYQDLKTVKNAARTAGVQLSDSVILKHVVLSGDDSIEESDWQLPFHVTVLSIHGYVPDPGIVSPGEEPSKARGEIVLTESQYATRTPQVIEALNRRFDGQNILVVGSSVADAPLVGALAATREAAKADEKLRRVLLVAKDDHGSTESEALAQAWADKRLSVLGLTPIYTDFHLQTAQLLHEAQSRLQANDGHSMTGVYAPHRYGSRLTAWWRDWFEAVGRASEVTQTQHHERLRDALETIRSAAGIPLDEGLKIELWIRWRPESCRLLGLWASSVGTWGDPYLMRFSQISPQSNWSAARIFCNGSPMFTEDRDTVSSRWRSYFGTPIWVENPYGRIPVGAITIASLFPEDTGSIGAHNAERMGGPALSELRRAANDVVAFHRPDRDAAALGGADELPGRDD